MRAAGVLAKGRMFDMAALKYIKNNVRCAFFQACNALKLLIIISKSLEAESESKQNTYH